MSVFPPPADPQDAHALGTQECPRCGTPYEPDQEYCLECGLRLPTEATGVIPRLSQGWRRRLGWYPGDWVWPSLLALVIAALAGLGAAAFVSHDEQRAGYVTGTSPIGALPVTTAPLGTSLTPTSTTTVPAQTGTQPPAPSAVPAAPLTLKAWPAGRSGWTVVLQALPTKNGRSFALAQARAAIHGGLQSVGIIDSSQFASLHPGYYLLFTGIYSSFDDANTGATTARSHGYPRAYPQQITP